MADGFRSPASQQNPEQFLHRNPFVPPGDLRMMSPGYQQAKTRMGHFHGEGSVQTTSNVRPPFASPQYHPAQPRNPFAYRQGPDHRFYLGGNQGTIQQQTDTFPNAANSSDFRTSGYTIPPSQPYGVGTLAPLASFAEPSSNLSMQAASRQSFYGFPSSHRMTSPVADPTHQAASPSLCPASGDSVTAQSDQMWVENFAQQRRTAKTDKDETSPLKIWEAKELLRKWLHLITDLKNQRDKLIEGISLENSEWDKLLKKAEQLEEKVSKVEAIFSNPELMEKLVKLVASRKKKRVSQKSCREGRMTKRKEAEERRSLLHKKIDSWREQAISKEEASRKAALLKSEAGGVLGEVRRKLCETTKALELLKSLKKLRDIRKLEAEKKGVYRRPTDGESKYFNERLEYMEKLMTRRQALYEVEQKALEVMLTEEEEEKYRKKREERRIQQDLFKARDPMEDFYNYYNQADQSLQSLLQIRHQWDAFLVPEHVPGASRVPEGWVSPVGPSSELWASVVTRRETDKSGNSTERERNDTTLPAELQPRHPEETDPLSPSGHEHKK